ncbi:MAG: DUF1009 domain-containing protein [Candidatus Aminicenantes bacterium]|nr:DUF1009 domain-containing protein [Candidatus Aminicenantes bacterium]
MSREKKLGVIAGSGEIPFYICQRAKKEGYDCVVAGIQGESDPKLKEFSDEYGLFEVKDFMRLVSWLQGNGVNQLVLAGKVRHTVIYSKESFSPLLLSLMERPANRSPEEMIKAVFAYLESQGIKVMDPSQFVSDLFCHQGVLSGKKVPSFIKEEIGYGWPIARQIADLDIGQTVVVKDQAVVAVEAMEGTDRVIQRGGSVAGPGCVVLKAARTHQDPRIDQPTVGLKTIQSLIQARCSALCIQARKVLFLDKSKGLELADKKGLSIIVKE